jgi:hypothetical protein
MAQNKHEPVIPERIYLLTDRNVYIAGDYLFYALYLQGKPGQMSKYAYLTLRDRNNMPVTKIRVDIKNQIAFGNVYLPDTLRTDIYQIVCYTNYMRNDGEDSFFKKEILIANRFDKKSELFDSTINADQSNALRGQYSVNETGNKNLVIHLNKMEFSTREKVMFSIETKNIPADSITRLSISISEITPGIPVEPSISDYFAGTNEQSIAIKPNQYLNNYHLEVKGSVIEGRVLSKPKSDKQSVTGISEIDKDANNYTILVSTPDSIANLQYTTTDSLGAFCIFLNRYYEGKELIIRLKNDAKAYIEPDNKFELTKPFIPTKSFTMAGIRSYLVRSRNISEVQRYYNEKPEISSVTAVENASAIPRVYFTPDAKVVPADYLPLPDFVEISRELLPGFRVRKSNENYTLSFISIKDKGILNIEPKIFLDGVLIDDVNQIINLGTNKIKRIEILPVIRYYGEMPLTGILAIFSKNSEINNIQFTTPTIKYQALSSLNYTKPKHFEPADINSHIPDVRQVLLWDPEIILHNKEKLQIECYTSDLQGNYLISIQGLTSNGVPVNGSAIITVKSKSN